MKGFLAGVGGAIVGVFGGPQMGAAVQGAFGGLLGNAGALQGGGQQGRDDSFYALRQAAMQPAAVNAQWMTADYLAACKVRQAAERETLVTLFLTDRISTWLQRSPGDETFGEWAHREEL